MATDTVFYWYYHMGVLVMTKTNTKSRLTLEEQYVELFGRVDTVEEVDNQSSLVQPGLGRVVDSIATSYLLGGEIIAELESDTKRN